MTVKELNIDDLTCWIKNQAQLRNKSAILIEIDNTIACIVNALLAKKTGIPVHAIINFDINQNYQLSNDFCKSFNIDVTAISSELNLKDFIPEINSFQDKRITYKQDIDLSIYMQNLARIAYIAETTNSLVLSNITRNDYLFVRNYPRLNSWDILPFGNLPESAINNLLNIFTNKSSYVLNDNLLESIKAIVDIAPKPDLTSEWLYDVNERTKPFPIIESEQDPTKHPKWFSYTVQQKFLIAKVYQIEKATRFKINNIPIFK